MQEPQNDTVMNFGPNLFGGQGGSASNPSADDADASNDALEDTASFSNQMTGCSTAEETPEAAVGEPGENSTPSSGGVVPGRQGSTQTKAGKSEVGRVMPR